jgi:hypothetical protein
MATPLGTKGWLVPKGVAVGESSTFIAVLLVSSFSFESSVFVISASSVSVFSGLALAHGFIVVTKIIN